MDEVSASAKHAQEKAAQVEQRMIKEVEESENALEELTKQVKHETRPSSFVLGI